jgi:hypothetical protein
MLNKFDLLSPPITLFYLGKRTHTSRIGGSLILLLFVLCSTYLIYLVYLIIGHKQITSIFYKKFEYDIGQYYLNSSSIYYFIQFHSIDDHSYLFNNAKKYFRIYSYFGNTDFEESYLDKVDHWVYDTCRENIDDNNLDKSLFQNINNFNNSACLRYYYNSTEKIYYSIDNEKFIWPYLAHGTSQKNNIFLHTTIEKCTDNSPTNQLFGECPSQEEMDEYTSKIVAIFLYFIDYQVDPTNYHHPIRKYMQSITSGVGTEQGFEENYVFFSPLRVRTTEGSILQKTKDLDSLYFDSNVKMSSPNVESYFKLGRFTHFMQNNMQIYERRYDDAFEILSDIGGIMQCFFNFLYWINYLYNSFIIVSDTNKLFFSILEKRSNSLNGEKFIKKHKNTNFNDSSIYCLKRNKSNTIMDSAINKFGIIKDIIEEKNDSNNIGDNMNDNSIKLNLIEPKKNKKIPTLINMGLKNDSFLDKKSNNISNNIYITNKIKELHYHSSKLKTNNFGNRKLVRQNTNSFNHDLKAEIFRNSLVNQTMKLSRLFNNKIKLKKKYSFFIFLKSLCSSKFNNINFLIKYRKCLLSEEHMLRSHISHIILERRFSVDKSQNINVNYSFDEC